MNSTQPVVFVVTGNTSLGSELCATLEKIAVNVTKLGSATEYLTHAARGEAACLIVDVDLPDMSGFELQQRVRGPDAPVVIVSASGQIWQSVYAMKLGAVDYLAFPGEPATLLGAVHEAIAQDRIGRGRRQRFTSLTPRERQVARLVVRGLRHKNIAEDLGISIVTVQIHRCSIMRKMGVRSLPDLVRMVEALGLSGAPPAAAPAGGFQAPLPAS